MGYYDQENADMNPQNTALEEVWQRYPRMAEQEVRNALGCVLLTGENVYKKIGELSGGERAKVEFAILRLRESNVLLLDEPTNHLDLQTKEAIEDALREFEGVILLISHDRYLLNRVPDQILDLSGGRAILYNGNFDAYLEQKAELPGGRCIKVPLKESDSQNKQSFYKGKEQRRKAAMRKARLPQGAGGGHWIGRGYVRRIGTGHCGSGERQRLRKDHPALQRFRNAKTAAKRPK